MPRKGQSTSTDDHSPASMPELPQSVLTEAVIQAFKSKDVISAIVPVLAEAIHDLVTDGVYKALELELVSRDDKIRHLELSNNALQERLDDLEQYSRRNCIVFHGIPDNAQPELPTQLTDKVNKIATEHLGGEIPAKSIDRIHRLGQKPDVESNPRARVRNRPVIVKFTDYSTRDRVYRARSSLKGTGIYLHESLTLMRQKWLKQARNHPSARRTWTQDGKIFVLTKDNNKRIVIASSKELSKLN